MAEQTSDRDGRALDAQVAQAEGWTSVRLIEGDWRGCPPGERFPRPVPAYSASMALSRRLWDGFVAEGWHRRLVDCGDGRMCLTLSRDEGALTHLDYGQTFEQVVCLLRVAIAARRPAA